MYFAPSNNSFGSSPSVVEIIDVVRGADSRIAYFDAGSAATQMIVWDNCDPEYINLISLCRFVDPGEGANNIRIAPTCLLN